jgi:hypothetical protein
MKRHLKKQVNSRKGVGQRKYGSKFYKQQTFIRRQIKKLGISNYVHEKTPERTSKKVQKKVAGTLKPSLSIEGEKLLWIT